MLCITEIFVLYSKTVDFPFIFILFEHFIFKGFIEINFPGGSEGKESAFNAGDSG